MQKLLLKYYILFALLIAGISANASEQNIEVQDDVFVSQDLISTVDNLAIHNKPKSQNEDRLFWEENFEEEDNETDSDDFHLISQPITSVYISSTDSKVDDFLIRCVLPSLKNKPSLKRSIRIDIQVFRI